MRPIKTALIILLAFLTLGLCGQNRVDFGLRAGIATSEIYTDLDDYTSDKILGYQAGAFFRIFITKNILIQPEAYFVKKGGELIYNNDDTEDKVSFEVSSLDVPLLLGFKFLDLEFTRIILYAGPVMSFAQGKSLEFIEDGKLDIQKSTEYLLQNTNWGFQAGGSIDILIFTLDLRYEWGLNDIYQGDDQFRQNAFLLGVGIRLF
ncbi:MAG TPA: porin family protein [Bacteroidales bacterium]|nr:porin family protein [Bacteroidales bacterium]HNS47752.1 porin family protein [Bacteroidales bacterium]